MSFSPHKSVLSASKSSNLNDEEQLELLGEKDDIDKQIDDAEMKDEKSKKSQAQKLSLSPHKSGLSASKASNLNDEEQLELLQEKDEIDEKDVKDKPKEKPKKPQMPLPPSVGILQLFRFAKGADIFFIIAGLLFSIANGVATPCMQIVFGKSIHQFVSVKHRVEEFDASNQTDTGVSKQAIRDDMLDATGQMALYFVYLGIGIYIAAYGQMTFWGIAAERQCRTIRFKLFHTILRRHIGWFDVNDTGQLNTRLTDDVDKIKEGLGEKIGALCQYASTTVTGLIIAFVYGWKLTLVMMAMTPLMALSAIAMTRMLTSFAIEELTAYALAGSVAEEVLGAIRTVAAFAGQDKEIERYCSRLNLARTKGTKKWLIQGLGMGFLWLVIYGMYSLGFWYGGVVIRDQDSGYTEADILIVFFSMAFASFALGSATPNFMALAQGRGAAYTIYGIIDEESEIDSFSEKGKSLNSLSGEIRLEKVHFSYPSRTDVKVLDGLTMNVKEGETLALVGSSGCGKSTITQLIQRFYDPARGSVTFGGMDVRDLNVRWLREQIGVVSQEPVLFGTTIAENIRFGRLNVTVAEIEEATRQANAYDFIMKLPDKFDTLVGERGALLSGGQKQRIAIARALVRNPTILLLDEATSALDTESEAIVQDALDKASAGRTTIVVAHRLSTIRGADRIVALQEGKVVEEGAHDDLMQIENGVYATLVKAQTQQDEDKDDESDDDSGDEGGENGGTSLCASAPNSRMGSRADVAAADDDFNVETKQANGQTMRIFRMNGPEWPYILVASLAAVVSGSSISVFGIVYSRSLFVFRIEEEINKYCLIFLGIALISFCSYFLQSYMYGLSGERLTMRIRQRSFTAMLNQDQAWFDDNKNNTGALCTRLATEASQVQGATGARVGMLIQFIGGLLVATIIAFCFEWATTLMVMAFVPFLLLMGYIMTWVMTGTALSNKKALEQSGKVAVECIENIRTVTSLTRQQWFYDQYTERFARPYKSSLKKTHIAGAAFGFSQACMFFVYGASFYFGAWRISTGSADPLHVFTVFMALIPGTVIAGQAGNYAPDYAKAKSAALSVFRLLDRVPTIDSSSPDGLKPPQDSMTSGVKFRDVRFSYPTRANVKVFRGLSLDVIPGQTVALVGSSGCGKSSAVSLLERLYDPTSGSLTLDDHELRELNVQWLRAQIGIVSQEPVLFDRSIRENIAYGDNSRDVPAHEVIEAARSANIHAFIDSLPMKYDTNVGAKGTQLSGGQKQRVAIARALVRNPKVLLLDEATSALDTESEKVVQEALDRAREGRTCIVIAHRLSTVQNADKIFVIRHGIVSESGTHSELMANRRFYYKLVTHSQ